MKREIGGWLLTFVLVLAAAWVILWAIDRVEGAEDTPEELAAVCIKTGNGFHGSGVVVGAKDGSSWVMTNQHVIRDAQPPILVGTLHKPWAEAIVANKGEADADVALLQIKGERTFVPLASGWPAQGTQVYSIGYPQGSTTQKTRRGQVVGYEGTSGHLRLSYSVLGGESGSPVYSGGKVVGMIWGEADGAWGTYSGKLIERTRWVVGGT